MDAHTHREHLAVLALGVTGIVPVGPEERKPAAVGPIGHLGLSPSMPGIVGQYAIEVPDGLGHGTVYPCKTGR